MSSVVDLLHTLMLDLQHRILSFFDRPASYFITSTIVRIIIISCFHIIKREIWFSIAFIFSSSHFHYGQHTHESPPSLLVVPSGLEKAMDFVLISVDFMHFHLDLIRHWHRCIELGSSSSSSYEHGEMDLVQQYKPCC